MAHVIRLRGPWELARPSPADAGTRQRIDFPSEWLARLAEWPPPYRLLRRFGLPSGLTGVDRVLLVLDRLDVDAGVSLNGTTVGTISAGRTVVRFDVTQRLVARNALELEIHRVPQPRDQTQPIEVRLEIGPGPEVQED